MSDLNLVLVREIALFGRSPWELLRSQGCIVFEELEFYGSIFRKVQPHPNPNGSPAYDSPRLQAFFYGIAHPQDFHTR